MKHGHDTDSSTLVIICENDIIECSKMCFGRVSVSVSTVTHVEHAFEQKCRCYGGYMLILSGFFD